METAIWFCKKVMEERNLKPSDISRGTGLPESTVRSALSQNAKSPSMATFGPICAFLRVSLDDIYGIIRPGRIQTALDQASIDLVIENATQAEVLKNLRAANLRIRKQNKVLICTNAVVSAAFLAAFVSLILR